MGSRFSKRNKSKVVDTTTARDRQMIDQMCREIYDINKFSMSQARDDRPYNKYHTEFSRSDTLSTTGTERSNCLSILEEMAGTARGGSS